jgi:hypothetical protein
MWGKKGHWEKKKEGKEAAAPQEANE